MSSAPILGAHVSIAAGRVLAGSRPGTPLRRTALEADLAPIDVPAFEIDRRAVPIDGRTDPQRTSAADAAASCAARSGRLCDELEWERACEGEAHVALPTASGDLAACIARPETCVGAMGLLAQGVLAPEWTTSGGAWVLRGARADQDASFHRCDARTPLADPSDREGAIRCCYGPAPALAYPPVRSGPPFAPLAISVDALRAALASTEELAPWAGAFEPFDVDEAAGAYARADVVADETVRARLAPGPLAWSPAHGEIAWVLAGRSGADTLIAVLYPLDGGGVVHGASFVFRGEQVPVAMTAVPRERTSISWSTAVGRPGESGSIRLDPDGIVRIVGQ